MSGNLLYNVVLVSAALQRESVIVIYIYPLPPKVTAAESRALCSGSTLVPSSSACLLCSMAQDSTR